MLNIHLDLILMLASKNGFVSLTKYTHGEVNINSAGVYSALRYLAAKRSSRSDVVTQFVFSFVFSPSPFFSFSVLEVSSSPKEVRWCFKAV